MPSTSNSSAQRSGVHFTVIRCGEDPNHTETKILLAYAKQQVIAPLQSFGCAGEGEAELADGFKVHGSNVLCVVCCEL